MKQQRRTVNLGRVKAVAVRLAVLVASTGIVAVGAVAAPAEADTGWNRQIAPSKAYHP